MDFAEKLKIVKDYAKANYEKGWDVVIETMVDDRILEITQSANTRLGVLRAMARAIRPFNSLRKEHEAEAKLGREELVACIKQEAEWAKEQLAEPKSHPEMVDDSDYDGEAFMFELELQERYEEGE